MIALVGGGGKTSLMYALAAEMASSGTSVITTTTTKIFPPSIQESPCLVLLEQEPNLDKLAARLGESSHLTVGRAMISSGKVDGIADLVVEQLRELADWIVVEADGAGRRPIKAPEVWEPVIPRSSDLVIPVVGLDCLGRPADDHWVFRLEKFLEVAGLPRAAMITPESIGRLMGSSKGGLKDIPESAKVVPFLNKTDLVANRAQIRDTVREIVSAARGRISQVVAGTLVRPISIETFIPGYCRINEE